MIRRYASCCSRPHPTPRTTTKCLDASNTDYLVFGVSRHPVLKFESGVREAWAKGDHWLRGKSADELLQLQMANATWLNEHLEPTSFRLSGRTASGEPVQIGFMAKTETLAHDMRRLADMGWCKGDPAGRCPFRDWAKMLDSYRMNARQEDPASQLSDEGVRTFCTSELYGGEAEKYGYDCLHPPREEDRRNGFMDDFSVEEER